MKSKSKYIVRVLFNDFHHSEKTWSFDSLDDAIPIFVFYIRSVLEFKLNVRVINIFHGKKSIKMFKNY